MRKGSLSVGFLVLKSRTGDSGEDRVICAASHWWLAWHLGLGGSNALRRRPNYDPTAMEDLAVLASVSVLLASTRNLLASGNVETQDNNKLN